MKKNKKGFTIIEILFIVLIIRLLASIILVTLNGAKKKSKNNSAFTSFKSVAAPAYACLSNSLVVTLTAPDIPTGGNDICSNPTASAASNWPNMEKTGWVYSDSTFFWCNINDPVDSPPSACPGYNNNDCGGNNSLGKFCFMMQYDGNTMWCTAQGCRKDGF